MKARQTRRLGGPNGEGSTDMADTADIFLDDPDIVWKTLFGRLKVHWSPPDDPDLQERAR